jgi:hypothetical protein
MGWLWLGRQRIQSWRRYMPTTRSSKQLLPSKQISPGLAG